MRRTIILWIFVLVTALGILQGCSRKPELPISVTFRKAALDTSLVAQFNNHSASAIKVLVEIHSNATGVTKQAEIIIDGEQTKEIGWAEGWRFVPGENIKVKHGDYKTLEVVVH